MYFAEALGVLFWRLISISIAKFQTLHTSFGFCSRHLQDQGQSAAVSADRKYEKLTSDTEALGKSARPFEVTANSISLGVKAAASSSDH